MRLVVWLWVRLMLVLGMEESGEDLTENPGDVIRCALGARSAGWWACATGPGGSPGGASGCRMLCRRPATG